MTFFNYSRNQQLINIFLATNLGTMDLYELTVYELGTVISAQNRTGAEQQERKQKKGKRLP